MQSRSRAVARLAPRALPFLVASAALLAATASATPAQLSGPSAPCKVDVGRELWIKDLSVVNDPVRTIYVNGSKNPSQGVWSFGRLMENMAGDNDPSEFVIDMFEDFTVDLTINGHSIPAREALFDDIIQPWIDQSEANGFDGLDFSIAPFRLNGIVNRIDLRTNDTYGTANSAGEGRIVFSFLSGGEATLGTLIMEYELLADDCDDVLAWANRWHALGQVPFGEDYNKELEKLVNLFAGAGAAPGHPNGSAISQVRTNEILGLFPWQWREWHLDPATGFLDQATVAQTIQTSLNGTKLLRDYVNENEAAILAGEHVVPLQYQGQPFRGGSSDGGVDGLTAFFAAPGILNNDARQIFSLNNCVACHTTETGTGFFHSSPRSLNSETFLSGFLTGITIDDPVDPKQKRTFNDLKRRVEDLCKLLGETCAEISNEKPLVRVH